MLRFVFVFCLSAPFLLTAQTPLTYTIEPVRAQEPLRLRVEIAFTGESDGETFLAYQNHQFGEPDQMQFLVMEENQPGVEIRREPDSNRWVVRHRPGALVQLRYEVMDRRGEQPFYVYCCHRPILESDYFHILSGHLLVVPAHYWSSPSDHQKVVMHWRNFPDNWVVHNSFGPEKNQEMLLTNAQLNAAVFVGGDFQRYTFSVREKPVYFLTREQWTNWRHDTLVQLLQKTFEGHRTFWNDFSDSTYTVTFLPIKDAPWSDTSRFVSAGGSGLTNSFMSFGTDNPGLTYDLIRYIYVHELMHRWIGIKIENKEEEKQYWFSEGFTDYFTLKNMVRYGLTGIDEWLSAFNEEFIAPHYASPLRAMPNDSLNYERFWSGEKEWEKLPYRRGAIYAFYLNESLLKKSKGRYNLDAFMRELLVLMEQNPGQKLDNTLFKTLLRGKLGKSGVRDFEQFIEKGQPIDLERIPLPPGFGISVKDRPVRQNFVNQAQKTYPNIPQLYKKSGISEEVLRGGLLR